MKNLFKTKTVERLLEHGLHIVPVKYTFNGLRSGIGFDILTDKPTMFLSSVQGKFIAVSVEPQYSDKNENIYRSYLGTNGGTGYGNMKQIFNWAVQDMDVRLPIIEFCGDHEQYFRPQLKYGYSLVLGVGCDEAEAYQDAANTVYCADNPPKLPKRYGNKKRGLSYYFGREVARQIRQSEENNLWVYCLIYLPE